MKKIFLIFITSLLFADVSNILYKIALENDLSNKTKKENSGILYLFTREDIKSLQIKHLRDILKILPIGYKFNRFGIIDPFNPNTNIPFLSSIIKVFINNQEIVSGFYNSGLAVLNDIDIGWADHIEVYTQAPSLEIATEPSLIIIKIFTKKASRDNGNNIHLSKGSKSFYAYFEKAKKAKYSYYVYLSKNDEKSSNNNSVYRKQVVFNLYDETSSLLAYILHTNNDGLFGFSLDGKVDKSYIKNNYFHIGYNKKWKNFSFYIASSFSYTRNKTYYHEEPLLFIYKNIPISTVKIESSDRVIDINLKYKRKINRYIFILGINNRFKHFNWNKLYFNNFELPQTKRDKQNVNTLFFQISKILNPTSILNFGYAYSYFYNNGGFNGQKTHQYRLSHTCIKDKLTFKTVFSHIEFTLDPYLINSIYVKEKLLKPAKINNIFENVKYESEFYSFDFVLGYLKSKHYFFPDSNGLLENTNKHIQELYLGVRYDNLYRPFSKFSFEYFYHNLKQVPKYGKYKVHRWVIYNYNNFLRKSFFEELVISKEENNKFYYDLTLGAKKYINDRLDFFIKGENLLNKGEKYKFFSFNALTNTYNLPLVVPLIQRRIMVGMEYSF